MYAGDEQYGDEITSGEFEDEIEDTHDSPYDNNHFLPEFFETVHVHVETSASDCDGPLDRSYTYTPDEDDTPEKFFVRFMTGACAYNGEVTVTLSDDGRWTARHGHPTDEGFHAEEHQSCVYEDCRGRKASQRDHFAEAMGY